MKGFYLAIKKQVNIVIAIAYATYKEWSVYRSHSLVSLFVGTIYFLVQLFIWKSVYSSKTSIYGITLEQMITYFAVAALINYLIMDFAFSRKVGHRILGLMR